MVETVVETLVIEDTNALTLFLAEQYPQGLHVDMGFLANLVNRGLVVDDDDSRHDSRRNVIAPSGAIMPGVFLRSSELPQGEGCAEPEDTHG